jgi:hypothetical protein
MVQTRLGLLCLCRCTRSVRFMRYVLAPLLLVVIGTAAVAQQTRVMMATRPSSPPRASGSGESTRPKARRSASAVAAPGNAATMPPRPLRRSSTAARSPAPRSTGTATGAPSRPARWRDTTSAPRWCAPAGRWTMSVTVAAPTRPNNSMPSRRSAAYGRAALSRLGSGVRGDRNASGRFGGRGERRNIGSQPSVVIAGRQDGKNERE